MPKTELPKNSRKRKALTLVLVLILILASYLTFITLVTKPTDSVEVPPVSFPVSVNPQTKQIIEDPELSWYVEEYLAIDVAGYKNRRYLAKMMSEVMQLAFVQQLASTVSRTLIIYPGERKEEVAKNFSRILGWSMAEEEDFLALVEATEPTLTEGKFYPSKYVLERTATPAIAADVLLEKFDTEILSRYSQEIEAVVPLEEALTIASLLEREAYDFTDMRIISGIIWNRLFIDMPLQLDATLQYAKGNNPAEPKWWPIVRPDDKYIDSPFNTYEIAGLPPSPIANPSVESVVAALNPELTDCFFYFHADDGTFYCSVTYEEHVAKLTKVFGQGR